MMAGGNTKAGIVKPPMTAGSLAIAMLTPDEAAKLEAEFWAQTEECPDTGCRFWAGGKAGKGCWYGYLHVLGKRVGAHVFAYVFARGPISHGLEVRHGPTCEGHPHPKGRLCVNPEHLAVGSPAENREDRDGGWWRLPLADIPIRDEHRATAEAFMPHALAVEAGPDNPPPHLAPSAPELAGQPASRDHKKGRRVALG